ncbi:hypothetical protein [Gracilibacillus saliphilus]|uniref:hypothetical protein n=1 Tax=Gracilibacillus saliphilus TaxID=543890 RepID=UPI0013D68159|nr:hypothetical protein [Gracilibacillus saliphilus]
MGIKIKIFMDNGKEYIIESKTLSKFEARIYNEMALGARVLANGMRHFELIDGKEAWINPSHISSFEIVEETVRKNADLENIRNSPYYNPDMELLKF